MNSKRQKVLFFIFLALAIAVNVFIIVEGAISGPNSAMQSGGITQAFINMVKAIDPNSPIVTNPETTHYVIRKLVGHFGLFGISGLLTTATLMLYKDLLDKHKVLVLFISAFIGLFIAFVSEFMQLLTPGRVFSFIDTLIDFAGYVGFGGLLFLIVYLVIRHKEKKENTPQEA